MGLQKPFQSKFFATFIATEWLFIGMKRLMLLKILAPCKLPLTGFAAEELFSRVNPFMFPQVARKVETFVTMRADEWFFISVSPHMIFQGISLKLNPWQHI